MTFSREVNDGPRLILGQGLRQNARVIDIASDEDMPRVILEANQILQIASVGQLVVVNDPAAGLADRLEHEIRSYEPCSAGHKDAIKHKEIELLKIFPDDIRVAQTKRPSNKLLETLCAQNQLLCCFPAFISHVV